MIELYLLCLLLIVVFTVINVNSRLRTKKQKITQLAHVVQSLRLLLENLAKHRGMTNAYLKGDHSFKTAIGKLQLEINRIFENLTTKQKITSSLGNNK